MVEQCQNYPCAVFYVRYLSAVPRLHTARERQGKTVCVRRFSCDARELFNLKVFHRESGSDHTISSHWTVYYDRTAAVMERLSSLPRRTPIEAWLILAASIATRRLLNTVALPKRVDSIPA